MTCKGMERDPKARCVMILHVTTCRQPPIHLLGHVTICISYVVACMQHMKSILEHVTSCKMILEHVQNHICESYYYNFNFITKTFLNHLLMNVDTLPNHIKIYRIPNFIFHSLFITTDHNRYGFFGASSQQTLRAPEIFSKNPFDRENLFRRRVNTQFSELFRQKNRTPRLILYLQAQILWNFPSTSLTATEMYLPAPFSRQSILHFLPFSFHSKEPSILFRSLQQMTKPIHPRLLSVRNPIIFRPSPSTTTWNDLDSTENHFRLPLPSRIPISWNLSDQQGCGKPFNLYVIVVHKSLFHM